MSENLAPELDAGTPEIDLSEVKSRSVKGILALTSRTFFIQIVSFLATFALTIFLSPQIYGIFFLVSSVVNFLSYFSDIGLAAALIQKRSKITRSDLVTTFTVQQILVVILLIFLFGSTSLVRRFYQLDSASIYLMWALGFSFFLSSLKTIPSINLERQIKFDKLIIPQIAENLVFNISAVYLAWKGWGINTFTVAVLLRGIVGLVSMYIISPWLPGFGINKHSLKGLLKFGLPYQANTFLAVLKDDGMTILLGKIIGASGLGYIGWASKWANMPLRIFLDNVSKVAFPAFSRMQNHKHKLAVAIELSLKYLSLLTFPILIVMAFLAHPVMDLIPKYSKWLPALIPLYLYVINAAWASISTMLTNTLNAIGRIKTTFKLMIMWTALTWLFMPFLAIKFGFMGVAIAAAMISFTSVIVVIVTKKYVNFSVISALCSPIIASLTISLFLYFARSYVDSTASLIVVCILTTIIYFISILMQEGSRFAFKTISYFSRSSNEQTV